MDDMEVELYTALMNEVEEVKKCLNLESTDTALLLMIYNKMYNLKRD